MAYFGCVVSAVVHSRRPRRRRLHRIHSPGSIFGVPHFSRCTRRRGGRADAPPRCFIFNMHTQAALHSRPFPWSGAGCHGNSPVLGTGSATPRTLAGMQLSRSPLSLWQPARRPTRLPPFPKKQSQDAPRRFHTGFYICKPRALG
jgi:hypothetical protein